ncbi:MAG: geranyl transferase [Oleiphilus sp.]|nr:MAG: geranyl transferase [Oleiphilus sp.]
MSSIPAAPASFIETYRQQIDQALNRILCDSDGIPERLFKAMQHSTLSGGKRIRPILTLCSARCLGGSVDKAMPAACAVEMIHAYSLVHDDLPAMDDDDLRRGQPTCHIAFDEATAILAGDALQALAFDVIARKNTDLDPEQQLGMTRLLAKAAGARGMVAGQSIDLDSVGQTLTSEALSGMHALKTGALIQCAVELGALCSDQADPQEHTHLSGYAKAIGLGFQVQDDILDITSATAVLGKQQGADKELNKPTFPALLGLEGSKQKLKGLHEEAYSALARLNHRDTSELRQIADYIVTRVF